MTQPENRIVIAGIDVPFTDLVGAMIKLALASIPAAIILSILFFGIGLVFTLLFGGLGAVLSR